MKDDYEIVFWSPLPKAAFKEVENLHALSVTYKKLVLPTENLLTRLLREASTYARLLINSEKKKNPSILLFWREPKKQFKQKVFYKLSKGLGRFLSVNYKLMLFAENLGRTSWSKKIINHYKKELQSLEPKSLFITHQRVTGLMPMCLAAQQLKIKTNTVIFSWDNLPKARLAVQADNYLVWSEWMSNEMEDYYPEISKTQVKLVGTPQFEFYLQEERIIQRKTFAERYNLDSSKKWICFSGDDKETSPYDPLFLNDAAQAIANYKDDIQLIFRRCPVDFSDRYDSVLKKFETIIVSIDPIWENKSENWVGYFPTLDDIDMQVNLAHHCECVINLGSTMAHDFAVLDKPCLYLNYDPVKDDKWTVKNIYKFQHFRSMKALNAVGWINSKEDYKILINKLLKDSKAIGEDRVKWLQTIVKHPIGESSKLIADSISV